MTNRDYMDTLSNKKLASMIGRTYEVCRTTKHCETSCEACCLKWLERVRVPKVGGIYQDTDGTAYMVLGTTGRFKKGYSIISVDGHITYRAEKNMAKDKNSIWMQKHFSPILSKKREYLMMKKLEQILFLQNLPHVGKATIYREYWHLLTDTDSIEALRVIN